MITILFLWMVKLSHTEMCVMPHVTPVSGKQET